MSHICKIILYFDNMSHLYYAVTNRFVWAKSPFPSASPGQSGPQAPRLSALPIYFLVPLLWLGTAINAPPPPRVSPKSNSPSFLTLPPHSTRTAPSDLTSPLLLSHASLSLNAPTLPIPSPGSVSIPPRVPRVPNCRLIEANVSQWLPGIGERMVKN